MAMEIVTESAQILVVQATAVCRAAHRSSEGRESEFWGLILLVEGVSDLLAPLRAAPTEDGFAHASNALSAARTLVKIADDRDDDELIMATCVLLELAEAKLVEERHAFE